MTTKYKIIFGFALMVLLLVAMAGYGYRNIGVSSVNFEEYRRVAYLGVVCRDTASITNAIKSDTFQFLADLKNKTAIKAAHDGVNTLISLIQQANGLATTPYRSEPLKKMLAAAQNLTASIDIASKNLDEAIKLHDKIILPDMSRLTKDMQALGRTLYAAGDTEALGDLSQAWGHMAFMQSSLERFTESRNLAEGKKIREDLALFGKEMDKIRPYLAASQEGRDLYTDISKITDTTSASVDKMEQLFEVANSGVANFLSDINNIHFALATVNNSIAVELGALGPQILTENQKAQQYMLITSIAGVILGVILASGIVIGIVRVLSDLSGYAQAVAHGDVSRQPKTREKGEIGMVVEAMKLIPVTLKKILEEYRRLERKIEDGYLNAEGDASTFEGEFAVLVGGTNHILQQFRIVLENIPSPVVVLNRDLKAAYINRIARELVGEGWQGMTCHEMFRRDDYGTECCGLTIAVDTKAPASGETTAYPQGRAMDVAYTAIPMLDEHGNISAVLQLITDISAIKCQQRTMLQVASLASNISDRVAAASEELSTQVEEISRGAEMQRTRVTSTAHAITEMNSTVIEVAHNAAQAADQSQKSRNKAEDGSSLVNSVVQSINHVNSVALNLQGNMDELGSQAESIGSIMGVISDIADQTNLLALNAAIEAARAGDAGRGFAVVADEVRKLAEKTMHATQEVSRAIMAIQASARTNVDEVRSAVDGVVEATGLANASGAALDEI
ncbi:MAG: methyl-accepting chemotaxis protein, partial [Desulfovibrio sp.]|nr:methyl-accepting chemotaxis protein [Desulfovibrio sp.]